MAETLDPSRRDFLTATAWAMGAIGAGSAAWALIDSMNPAKDAYKKQATSEYIDLNDIAVGERKAFYLFGRRWILAHRTPEEIDAARNVDLELLPVPVPDRERVLRPEWLLMSARCSHLGHLLLGSEPGELRGRFGGWFCPDRANHYDTSGRIRAGIGPSNLSIPKYEITEENQIRIGYYENQALIH